SDFDQRICSALTAWPHHFLTAWNPGQ
ncbi:hypothetical protein A2U01_0075943, partial [Trifolium medium]|nr:hypothetical protein [Trifolium medium]